MISSLIKKLFSYLFPPTCIICGNEETTINICTSCSDKLLLTREMRRPWLFSLYRYRDGSVNTCIRHLKNFPDQELISSMIKKRSLMVNGWTIGMMRVHECSNIVIVPVPLHRSRYLDRGYNQAEIIARSYMNCIKQKYPSLSIMVNTSLITKSKYTDKQALILDRSVRLANIKNAFSFNESKKINLQHSLVIIIDDVTTTAGTMDEIYKILEPHAKAIGAFTLAH